MTFKKNSGTFIAKSTNVAKYVDYENKMSIFEKKTIARVCVDFCNLIYHKVVYAKRIQPKIAADI